MKDIKLGQKMYLIGCFQDSITEVEVIAIGKDFFVHSYSFNEYFIDEFRRPCYDDEENERWFRKLSDAKAYLKKIHKDCIIRKIEFDYWEVQFE